MFERPNWKDPECYKKLLEPNVSGWIAWEFLRRNSKYQKEIEKYQKEVILWQSINGNAANGLPLGVERFVDWCSHFEQKWNLWIPVMPSEGSKAAQHFIQLEHDRPEQFKYLGMGGRIDNPLVQIPVDLSLPIKVLQERLMLTVQRLRNEGIENGCIQPRTARILAARVYVEQLRILDAFSVGATVREIGDVLAPDASNDPESRQRDKRIKAAYTAALKMQNDGYRALLTNS